MVDSMIIVDNIMVDSMIMVDISELCYAMIPLGAGGWAETIITLRNCVPTGAPELRKYPRYWQSQVYFVLQ